MMEHVKVVPKEDILSKLTLLSVRLVKMIDQNALEIQQ